MCALLSTVRAHLERPFSKETMSTSTTYTATSWRDGSSWVVELPELDRSARAARLSQVEAVARELVASATRDDPRAARVVVDLRVPTSVRELLQAAAAAREDADHVSVEAVTLRRDLARRLAAEGFAVRDIAALLGVSYRRAHQLTGDAGAPGARTTGSPARVAAPRDEVADASSAEDRFGKPHDSYRHEAFLYRGDEEFLAGTVPFVHDGVALGQPVMVAVTEPRLGRLRDALGRHGDDVIFVDMAELGANPARIIPGWREFIDTSGGGELPVRGIGEPVWAGRRPTEIVECQLHEALLNVAVEPDTPLWLCCPYDVSALDESILEEASRSHPAVVDGATCSGSTGYGGAHHIDAMFRTELPEPATEATGVASYSFSHVADVRSILIDHAAEAGVDAARTRDLATAVTELATNSVRHGGGQGRLRVWRQPDAFGCEVTDAGHIDDPLVGRRTPSLMAEGGRGVWLANQLCDLVQLRSTPRGTTARVLTWL